jgi:deoxyribonuclease V
VIDVVAGIVTQPNSTLRCRNLHLWDVTTAEARNIQDRLRGMVVETWDGRQVRTVAGADVGFPDKSTALAAVVVLTFPGLEVVETRVARTRCTFPYVPGLLAFREIPGLLAALKMLETGFDLLMCDAQGLAHPRGMGLATHVGILLDRPVVGCAKSLLCGRFGRVAVKRGSLSRIKDDTGIAIGAALRTRDGVQPVYVSVGNRVDLATAIDLVLACSVKYRIPVPLRLAHRLSVGQEVAIGTRAARE